MNEATNDPDKEIFRISGPVHVTSLNWNNSDHRRIIVASLVNGVYTLEYDRQKRRRGTDKAQASPWWSTFQFRLYRELVDVEDNSIFGAIYEFNLSASHFNAPKYVVAFRGTLHKIRNMVRDFYLNGKIIFSVLHESYRSQQAMQAVQDIVSREGANKILLAGHSLGSAIALLTGKNMAKKGCFIETYLFNPPFPSLPMGNGIRLASSIIKSRISVAGEKKDNSFSALSEWVPKLFVNRADPICCGYVGYFEHRRRMEASGDLAAKIERRAAPISIGSMISGALGNDSAESLHLLPSAYLTINIGTQVATVDFKESIKVNGIIKGALTELDKWCKQALKAHAIGQWWDPKFQGQSELHKFR